jgi:AcrR family transcriptional regulator
MNPAAKAPAEKTNSRADGYHAAARNLLRESLLEAAAALMNDSPWNEISMAAIAKRAGVSRQTLYNEFGSRDVFAQAFALRVADRFLTEIEDAFSDAAEDPTAALYAGFLSFLELAAADPMVKQIVVRDPGADELLSLFTSRGGPVVELGRDRLSKRMLEIWPEGDADAARALAEVVVRLGISHAGLPVDRPEQAARQVTDLLVPFIELHLPSN